VTEQTRVAAGVPAGGQYKATAHAEAPVSLGAPQRARPELEAHGPIPAPLEGQKYLDGTQITATTFQEAYDEFFRPLEEYEAAHGPWQTTRVPSEDELLGLAGIREWKLGDVRGVFLETDEETGEPVVEVATRNGGYCCTDDCDGTCGPCIQDDMDTLPTFIRSEREDGDVTNFFRIADPAAAARIATDEKTRKALNHRLYAREAITSGKQPPWAILTPVRSGDERRQLTGRLTYAQKKVNVWQGALRYANEVTAALDAGRPLPKKPISESYPEGGVLYDMHCDALERQTAEAAAAKAGAAELHAELERGLPPAATALVAAEHTRLEAVAATAEKKAAENRTAIAKDITTMRTWAARRHAAAAPYLAEVTSLETAIRDFDWSSSWPGDPADCPQKAPQE
jgi:hypothetical protein